MKWLSLIGLWALLVATGSATELTLKHEGRIWSVTQDEMAAMPLTRLETETPWTTGSAMYAGVALVDLLAEIGVNVTSDTLRLTALDNYAVETSLEMLLEADAVLVFLRNGNTMPVRAHGPYWLLFPFSERPELLNRDIRDVAVWHLKKIEFIP